MTQFFCTYDRSIVDNFSINQSRWHECEKETNGEVARWISNTFFFDSFWNCIGANICFVWIDMLSNSFFFVISSILLFSLWNICVSQQNERIQTARWHVICFEIVVDKIYYFYVVENKWNNLIMQKSLFLNIFTDDNNRSKRQINWLEKDDR